MIRWIFVGAGILSALALAIVIVGALLPQGHVATREATFARPAPDVYAVIAEVRRHPEWREGVREIEVLQDEPLRWKEDGADGAITYEVEQAAPPGLLIVRIADPDLPFGGRWIYRIEPADGGTRVAITEEGEVYNPLFRFVSRFVLSHTATIEKYLRDLERRLGA